MKKHNPNSTHIIVTFKDHDTENLFRASDGMGLGSRQNEVVVFGEEPNKRTSRVFLDGESALAFLKDHVAAKDLEAHPELGPHLVFETREASPVIIQPTAPEFGHISGHSLTRRQ